MRNREKVRSAIAVLMSLSLSLPPYTAYAEELPTEGGVGDSITVIEGGEIVEGSVGENVIVEGGTAAAPAAESAADGIAVVDGQAEQKDAPAAVQPVEDALHAGEGASTAPKGADSAAEGFTSTWFTNADGAKQDVDAVALTKDTKELKPDTFYVATGEIVNNNRLTVAGKNTNIILADGCKLNLKKGIFVDTTDGHDGELNIWRQTGDGATLIATAGDNDQAGIGGNSGTSNGTVNIFGGTVQASGKQDGAGIGGGENGSGGAINIYGGIVTAEADELGAGIGGGYAKGYDTDGGSITIAGGQVTAIGNNDSDFGSAGIGGGAKGATGTITITDGTVKATGGKRAAGIGSGDRTRSVKGSINIAGGSVTATGGNEGAGIGGGNSGSSGTVTISGGTVVANGKDHGAGIGGGHDGRGDTITIEGGTVTAKGSDYASGIGAGGDSGADHIAIKGGKVTAFGGRESAGIGGSNKGKIDSIEITGGDTIAIGGVRGAGVGGGDGNELNGSYDSIAISGKDTKVRAYGGDEAAGIGTGNEASNNNGTISIADGANVTAVGGTKNVSVSKDDKVSYKTVDFGAGIGGGDASDAGTITISGEGTVVDAIGAAEAAGIGSGNEAKSAGTITITEGAHVNATGGKLAAGIGGGDNCPGGKVTIAGYGTHVVANSGKNGAGIGGGECKKGGEVSIDNHATVEACATYCGSAIGRGYADNNKDIDDGILSIEAGACVKSGSEKKNAKLVSILDKGEVHAERLVSACHNYYVLVAPCTGETHEIYEWHNAPDTHQAICSHCGSVMHEERHVFDRQGVCEICRQDDGPVEYLDASGNTTMTSRDYTKIPSVKDEEGATLKSGWYVLRANVKGEQSDITFKNRLNVTGDVNILLCDGAKLTCEDGIHVASDAKLTIWGQEKGTGRLTVSTDDDGYAAIGSDENETSYAGTINIYGGAIKAESKDDAAAIGGGNQSPSGSIVIGGKKTVVSATSDSHGAAIGGGRDGKASSITIEGGDITAKSGDYAAAIGGGGDASADKIVIKGGTIKAFGGKESAAIGSANKGKVGTIEISGGDVTAIGSEKAAGIGGGDGADSQGGGYDAISISGDGTRIRAYGGDQAAGIGSGNEGYGKPGSITISGGARVTAIGGTKDAKLTDKGEVTYKFTEAGAGIGGGDKCSSGAITISGDKTSVFAKGASHGAGIGGGDGKGGDTITIEGGAVTATGGDYAAGIGGGGDAGADKIVIKGGKVKAYGGKESAGIGSANKGKVNSIEISGGDVFAVGAEMAAGIGAGDGNEENGTYGSITISGDTTRVRAFGGDEAAGIGAGNDSIRNYGTIDITGGADVMAVGGVKEVTVNDDDKVTYLHGGCDSGAGIGGADKTDAGTITIKGAGTRVFAEGSDEAAGIGSGDEADDAGAVTISEGADVYAVGGKLAAGIGGGDDCCGPKVAISGKDTHVEAFGGSEGAGIGGGENKAGSEVRIESLATVDVKGGKDAAPIGAGHGSKDSRNILLYNTACVTVGTAASPVRANERQITCQKACDDVIHIAPCAHSTAVHQNDEATHICDACEFCDLGAHDAAEPHQFDGNGTCTACGYTCTHGLFRNVSFASEGNPSLTFWVTVPKGVDAANARMTFSIDGKQKRTVTMDLLEAVKGKNGAYGFTFDVSAIEMAQPVKAVFSCGSEPVEMTASVRQCLKEAIDAHKKGDRSHSDTQWNYLWAMANLGHFTQPWLASTNGWKLGTDYVTMDLCKPEMNDVAVARKELAPYQKVSRIEGSGVEKLSASLVLDSLTTLRIYLTPEKGKSLTATATMGDATYKAKKLSDGRYLIEVTGIKPTDFDKTVKVAGTCDIQFSAELSVFAYLNCMISNADCSDESINALTAVYNYYKYASKA